MSQSRETLKLDDIGESSDWSHRKSRDKPTGCRVSVVQGFILTFLALVLVALVAVIVHFAGSSSSKECTCNFPTPQPISEEQQWQECLDLSAQKNICLSAPHCDGMPPMSSTMPPFSSTPSPTSQPINVRLPLNVVPDHYDVTLKPDIYTGDPDTFSFSGDVTIYMTCKKATDVIVLHINKLTIDGDVQLLDTSPSSNVPAVKNVMMETDTQFLKVYLNSELTANMKYILKISFTGPLKPDLVGLYWSSYMAGTETRYLATTQMQPTDARKTFPCFDEPAVKASFNVTLWRKTANDMKTLANMNLLRTVPQSDGWVADEYAQTVKMSTYLLAFIVCDFKYKSGTTSKGTEFRVWSRPEAIDQTDYALEKGIATIEYFEDYFNISFPLPKQDMIAVPDFAAGAMENWGLIIYRETALLYDVILSSASNKQRVAEVVVHELAHQWFGNLVTPVWWDDLWLNEGFASNMEYIGMSHIEPTWDMHDQFVERDLHRVLLIDSLSTSHPIYVPVNHPDEINEIFDTISYLKGASIIRMMNFFLGDSTFQTGLTNYLNAYAYDNSNHTDLWYYMGEQAKRDGLTVDVSNVMNTWVRQMGYPVVSITGSGGTRTVTQQHFRTDQTKEPTETSPYNYKWEIPLTFVDNMSNKWTDLAITWLPRNTDTTTITVDASANWLVGNIGQYGYFRVMYDTANWDALIQQLTDDHEQIPVKNRAQIIDDSINLGRSGYQDELIGLRTTQYLNKEKHYVPWKTAADAMAYYRRMLQFTEYNGAYQRYMLKLAKPLFDEMGLEYNQTTEPHLEKYKRSLAMSIACSSGYESCRTQVSDLFKQWMQNSMDDTIIQPDLKTVVYCNGISNGGSDEWNFLYEQYKQANVAAEKSRILYAITCSAEPWILNRLLHYSLDPDEIRSQDAVSVIIYISRNPLGKLLAWNFFRAQWETIKANWGGGFFQIANLISGLTASFNTEFELQEMMTFREENPDLGSGERSFEQALEATQTNINWLNQNKVNIGTWLEQNSGA